MVWDIKVDHLDINLVPLRHKVRPRSPLGSRTDRPAWSNGVPTLASRRLWISRALSGGRSTGEYWKVNGTTSREVDDRRIDIVIWYEPSRFYEVQVKLISRRRHAHRAS